MRNVAYFIFIILFLGCIAIAQSQEVDESAISSQKYTYKANQAIQEDAFADAEAEYRKAIHKNGANSAARYNLGNAYYKNENYVEAFNRYKQSTEVATTKAEKHKAFHNLGNIFMKNKEYEKAVEAYKNALRNNPKDDETRYNLALAKDMLAKNPPQDQDNKQDDKDGKDEKNKDKKEQDQKDKNKDEGDQDKDQKNEEGDDKKDKKNEGEGDNKDKKDEQQQNKDQKPSDGQKSDKEKKKQQPRPNQLSPQQAQSILNAIDKAEKKTQEKINAQKARGAKVKSDKDW